MPDKREMVLRAGSESSCPNSRGSGDSDTLILKCRECQYNQPFSSPSCIGSIINAFRDNLGVEKIEFHNHFTSTLDQRDMAFFRDGAKLLEVMEGLSLRSGGHDECTGCTYEPGALFKTLEMLFLEDVDAFGDRLETYAEGLLGFKGHRRDCGKCINKTAGDLNHLITAYLGLQSPGRI